MSGIIITLGRDGMGSYCSEEDFQSWVDYASDHLDQDFGSIIECVEERDKREVQSDEITGGTEEERASIKEAIRDIWERWCEEGRASSG